jgi:hypothetical protein
MRTLQASIDRDKEAIEAMQRRLEELGAPRMTVEELEALVPVEPPISLVSPQPKGRWRNGKFFIPDAR